MSKKKVVPMKIVHIEIQEIGILFVERQTAVQIFFTCHLSMIHYTTLISTTDISEPTGK